MIARALTIAGSDSGGGAGIQQDLKTFQSLGVWGMSAVTAVTVQDTTGVHEVWPVAPDVVASQIRCVAADIGVDAAKTGMLASAATVRAVVAALADAAIGRLVVDPVLAASDGSALLAGEAVLLVRDLLLPLATVITPNAAEAAALSGVEVTGRAGQRAAAEALVSLGAHAALVTGGHLAGDAVDVLATGKETIEISGSRVESTATHGTGCMLSAAIAAGLARGDDLEDAVRAAKSFVDRGLRHGLALGRGRGPVNPAP